MICIAVVGAGHWGPNLIRNFHSGNTSRVKYVVDNRPQRLELLKVKFPDVEMTADLGRATEKKDNRRFEWGGGRRLPGGRFRAGSRRSKVGWARSGTSARADGCHSRCRRRLSRVERPRAGSQRSISCGGPVGRVASDRGGRGGKPRSFRAASEEVMSAITVLRPPHGH